MDSHLNLVPWLVVAPVVAALLAPLVGFPLRGRPRRLVNVALELLLLAVAVFALREAPRALSWDYGIGGGADRLAWSLDRPAGAGIVLLAVLFLAISAYSCGFLGPARGGGAFPSLLMLEQAAGSFVLLAANLFSLYLGLFLLSVSLMLLVGIDFTPAGGRAALRVFATPEVPAAVALVCYWLIAARAGTDAFADLPLRATWLADPSATLLVLPVALALAARAGLFPLHRWVVAGCRTAATPAAVAVGGIAVPLGGYALWRVAVSALPLTSDWTRGLGVLGALTVVVGAIGAARERTALGWLGYAALVQIGLAVAGLALALPSASVGGWLALVGGSLSVALLGLSLGLLTRTTREDAIGGPASLPNDVLARLSLGVGFLAVAGFPPFPTFTARAYVLAGLLGTRSIVEDLVALLLLGGTLLFAAAAWKALARPVQSALWPVDGHRAEALPREPELVLAGARVAGAPAPPDPTRPIGRAALRSILRDPRWAVQRVAGPEIAPEVRLALGVLLALVVLPSFLAPASLAGALGLAGSGPPAAPVLMATVLAVLALAGGLGLGPTWDRLVSRLRLRKRVTRRFVWLADRLRLDDLTDPYLVVGGILTFLGRVSAELLDNTLGRLSRVG